MSDTDESKSAEERRSRLKALRERRRTAADASGAAAPAEGGEGEARGRLMKAIAKKRGLKGGAGAAATGGGRRRGGGGGRGAGRRLAAGGGNDAGGEQFPKLRKILARRRAQGGDGGLGGNANAAPEQQIGALKKRLQRLSDAVDRTEAELAAARDNAGPGGDAKARIRKKVVAKKVAARAARRKDSD